MLAGWGIPPAWHGTPCPAPPIATYFLMPVACFLLQQGGVRIFKVILVHSLWFFILSFFLEIGGKRGDFLFFNLLMRNWVKLYGIICIDGKPHLLGFFGISFCTLDLPWS